MHAQQRRDWRRTGRAAPAAPRDELPRSRSRRRSESPRGRSWRRSESPRSPRRARRQPSSPRWGRRAGGGQNEHSCLARRRYCPYDPPGRRKDGDGGRLRRRAPPTLRPPPPPVQFDRWSPPSCFRPVLLYPSGPPVMWQPPPPPPGWLEAMADDRRAPAPPPPPPCPPFGFPPPLWRLPNTYCPPHLRGGWRMPPCPPPPVWAPPVWPPRRGGAPGAHGASSGRDNRQRYRDPRQGSHSNHNNHSQSSNVHHGGHHHHHHHHPQQHHQHHHHHPHHHNQVHGRGYQRGNDRPQRQHGVDDRPGSRDRRGGRLPCDAEREQQLLIDSFIATSGSSQVSLRDTSVPLAVRLALLPDSYEFSPEDYQMLLELDEGIDRSANKDDIAALPETTHDGEGEQQCAICFVQYDKGDSIKTLPCSHVFHADCVDRWLQDYGKVCPLCKCGIDAEAAHEAAPATEPDASRRSASPTQPASPPHQNRRRGGRRRRRSSGLR